MKTLTQWVLPTAIVLGLIGMVAFFSQYSGSGPRKDKQSVISGGTPLGEDLLLFPVQSACWEGEDDTRAAEYELHSKGHYDFWFTNPTPAPVELKLTYTSCNCAEVSVGLPTERGQQKLAAAAATMTATLVLAPTQGWPNLPAAVGAIDRWPNVPGYLALSDAWLQGILEKEMTWHPLKVGESVSVPADPASLVAGVVRATWEGKNLEPYRLAAEFQTSQEGQAGKVRFEIPVTFVPAVRLDEEILQAGELNAKGQTAKRVFHCWSSTRDSFPLTVAEEKADPCITCKSEAMTEPERSDLAATLFKRGLGPTRVRSAYRVTVMVHERTSGTQMLDLGPFQRRLIVTGPDGTGIVRLQGSVKGDVTLHTPDRKDTLNLGSFKASRGTDLTVFLTCEGSDVQLKVDSWSPDYLTVALKPAGVKRWELTVKVPPGRTSGRLPEDSAVILQTQGETGRRMRIPLVGEAIQ